MPYRDLTADNDITDDISTIGDIRRFRNAGMNVSVRLYGHLIMLAQFMLMQRDWQTDV